MLGMGRLKCLRAVQEKVFRRQLDTQVWRRGELG